MSEILIRLSSLSGYDIDGDLDTVIENLIRLKNENTEYDHLRLDYTQDDPYDDHYSFVVYGVRDETKEENDKRLRREDAKKQAFEEGEKAQLAKLKVKYEEK